MHILILTGWGWKDYADATAATLRYKKNGYSKYE